MPIHLILLHVPKMGTLVNWLERVATAMIKPEMLLLLMI